MSKVKRTKWHTFPDVSIHAAELAVKSHVSYNLAKAGAWSAAVELVGAATEVEKMMALISRLNDQYPVLVSVHAEEE